jgi:endonuclease G
MMRRLLIIAAASLAVATPIAFYSPAALAQKSSAKAKATINSNCPAFYAEGRAPATVGAPARSDGRTICHSFYAVSYSTTLRNPLWTSYRLTREMALGADAIGRYHGTFRAEPGLTASEQGAHDDYLFPPFDRGHLTPANDAIDMEAQRDTFVITNVVPQISELNQGTWRLLEASVHELAEQEGEVFVVTGAVFAATPRLMRRPGRQGRIAVPDATFKALYVPSRNVAIGYFATNANPTVCTILSVAELTRRTGVNPFPSLPSSATARRPAFTLPRGVNVVRGQRRPLPAADCHPAANDR